MKTFSQKESEFSFLEVQVLFSKTACVEMKNQSILKYFTDGVYAP